MLAPFAYQSDAQLQQCKAQDAGKNTGKSGTDPVSTGKPDDQRNRTAATREYTALAGGVSEKWRSHRPLRRHATTI